VAGVGGVRAVDRPAGAAEVKRMWVAPAYRGTGLGRRLLAALEDLAREHGHDVVVLDTHRSLGESLSLYARAGYREVERYNDNPYAQAFFRKDL
jgi:GNAT superfamily N-acetyltransferase